jgi:tetratricopeptide (TPR) repeat protein
LFASDEIGIIGEDAKQTSKANQAVFVTASPRAQTLTRMRNDDELELPADVREELERTAIPQPKRDAGSVAAGRLAAAAGAYERDRYADALRITKRLLSLAPQSIAVRELHGLACYRLGRWEEAIKHLELVVGASEDESQIPVLMDCYRALNMPKKVETAWDDLRRSSPDADLLVEGRLVLAATRAQNGDLEGAIELLGAAGAARALRRPAERHIRQWYLLGDLLEKSGDIPQAREMFERVVRADPGLADASQRLAALGRTRRKKVQAKQAK